MKKLCISSVRPFKSIPGFSNRNETHEPALPGFVFDSDWLNSVTRSIRTNRSAFGITERLMSSMTPVTMTLVESLMRKLFPIGSSLPNILRAKLSETTAL